ncbi:unnamed protein product, partial [Brenthis ino]
MCPECSLLIPRQTNNDNTPIRSSGVNTKSNENINFKRGGSSLSTIQVDTCEEAGINNNNLLELIRSVVTSEISSLKDEFKSAFVPLKEELISIRQDFNSIKESLDFFSSKYDSLNSRIEKCEKELHQYSEKVSEFEEIKSTMQSILTENNNREQWARRSNIEIYGIPEQKNENLYSILQNVASKTSIKIDPGTDIDFITRVATKNKNKDGKKCKPIIVKFLCRWKKDEFLAQARKLKIRCNDLGFSNNYNNIYFNEHLTSTNKTLLLSVKKIAKEKNYKYVWIKNCSIMIRRSDNSAVLNISNMKDLNKIV